MVEMCGEDTGPKARPNRTLRPWLKEAGEGAPPALAQLEDALLLAVAVAVPGTCWQEEASPLLLRKPHLQIISQFLLFSVSFLDWGSCSLKLNKNPLNKNVCIYFICRKTQFSEPRPLAFHNFLLLQQVRD